MDVWLNEQQDDSQTVGRVSVLSLSAVCDELSMFGGAALASDLGFVLHHPYDGFFWEEHSREGPVNQEINKCKIT